MDEDFNEKFLIKSNNIQDICLINKEIDSCIYCLNKSILKFQKGEYFKIKDLMINSDLIFVKFSDNLRIIFAIDYNGNFYFISIDDKYLKQINLNLGYPELISFSPDNQWMAIKIKDEIILYAMPEF